MLEKNKKLPNQGSRAELNQSSQSLGQIVEQELMGNGGMPNNHLRLGLVDHFGETHPGSNDQLLLKNGRSPGGSNSPKTSTRLEANDFTKIVDDDVSGHSTEGPIHPPSPFLIIANKISKGPVILNV